MIVGKVLSEDENKELCALAVAIYIKDQLLARTFSNQSRWVYVLHCFICKVLNSIWLSSIHRTFYPFRHNEIKDIQNYNPYKYTNCLYLMSEKFSDDLPASTLRIHNVAVWLLFGQVPFLRENYVATTYFRYVICKSLWQRIFQRFCYVRIWSWC